LPLYVTVQNRVAGYCHSSPALLVHVVRLFGA
jgi:hypothetical protein